MEGKIIMATPIAPKQLTFEEYLIYDDGTDNRYELVDGELIMVPLPTPDHSDLIDLLRDTFREQIRRKGHPWLVKGDVGVYTGVNPQTRRDRSRTPDLCIPTESQWAELKANKKAAAVLKTPPLLVLEIVSQGSRTTDYQSKRSEYESAKVPEYWIVDLMQQKVTVLTLTDTGYQEQVFTNSDRLVSRTFPDLELTVERVLSV
jgi:Uma2 family endonuclease